jgi:hypothetical protein
MNKNNRLWILGAGDPEMEAVETLLKEQGEEIAYATVGGKRVHPGNAYKADGTDPVQDNKVYDLVLVECDGTFHVACTSIKKVDHHRPSDPGYGKSPKDFWPASSIGQVHHILFSYPEAGWGIGLLLNVAAADHCLPAAYRGECPGVDPEELMKWRAESRAKFQKRSVVEVLADVENARQALRNAPLYSGIMGRVADFRSMTIPELPEAAAREGIAFLAELKDRDGRCKVVLQAADEHQVAEFLATYPATEKYGDPARGFAGGYLPK